jgi:hypothetical protein
LECREYAGRGKVAVGTGAGGFKNCRSPHYGQEILCECVLLPAGGRKALKALYIELKREFPPKTHSLLRLSDELGIEDDEVIDAVLDLNPEYIVTRYPDAANEVPARIYNERMVLYHLEKVRKVI